MKWGSFLFICCAFALQIEGDGNAQECHGLLQCWLASLKIRIPNSTSVIPTKYGNITLDVDDFICEDIFIADFTSDLLGTDVINFGTVGIGLTCSGHIAFEVDHIKGSTNVQAIVADSSLTAIVEFVQKGLVMDSTVLKACSMDLEIQKLSFSGSILSWLLDVLKGFIEPYLKTEIAAVLCKSILPELINVSITNFVRAVDKEMEPYLVPAKPLNPVVPEDMNVVDWKKATGLTAIAGLLNSLLKGGTILNCVMDEVTNGTGMIELGNSTTKLFEHAIPIGDLATIDLTVHSLTVHGFNSFKSLVLLNVTEPPPSIGRHTRALSSVIELEHLEVDVYLDIATTLNTSTTLMENFTLSINMTNVLLRNSMLLGFQTHELEHLYLSGEPLHHWCLLASLWTANMTQLDLDIDIDAITFYPEDPEYLEKDIDQLLNTVLKLLTTTYRPLLRAFLDGVVSGPVRDAINVVTTDLISFAQQRLIVNEGKYPCMPRIAPNMSQPNWINWETAPVVQKIDKVLSGVGAEGVNRLLTCSMGSTDLNKSWIVNTSGLKANIRLEELQGLNSFYEFDLIQPAGNYVLNNTIGLAQCDAQTQALGACSPLVMGVGVDLQYKKVDVTINFTTVIQNLEILAGILMKLDRNKLDSLPLNQLLRSSCLLTCVDAVQIQNLTVGVEHIFLDLTVTGTTEFNFSLQGSKLDHEVDSFLRAVSAGTAKLFNEKTKGQKEVAPYSCIDVPVPTPGPPSDPIVWVEISALAFGGLLVLVLFIQAQRYPAKTVWLLQCRCCREKKASEESLMNVVDGRPRVPSKEGDPIDWRDSMMFNPLIPLWVRASVPITLALNIALFLTGNLETGAGVSGQFVAGDKTIDLGTLAEFTLKNSVHDMWQAGVYPLSILVALFSGGWPYVKLVLMGCCWCIPLQILSLHRRENLLMWLDALGKWSLIDTYVLVLFLVSFRFHVAEFHSLITVDIFVTPDSGFYLFLISTMLSLGLGHIILAFHRFSVPDYIKAPEGGAKLSLCTQSLTVSSKGDSFRAVRFTKIGQALVALLLALSLAYLIWGSYIDSFSFEFTGLAGMALGDQKFSYWSVDRLGVNIPSSSKDPSTFGVHWIQAVFFLFTALMPTAYLVTSILLWLIPLTIKRQRQIFVITEVFYAWSALEVFMVAIIAALTEISQFAEFTVGSKCDPILPFLEFFGDTDGCFGLKTVLLSGCWILFTSGLIFVFVGQTVCSICHAVLHHRLSQLVPKQPDEIEATPKTSCFTSLVVSVALRLSILEWDALASTQGMQDREGRVVVDPSRMD